METPVINKNVIRSYLLGELSDEEREGIEERLLVDDEFFNALTTLEDEVEEELVDQYVVGELTGREREQVERLFSASPERREKFYLARDLNNYASVAAADAKTNAPADDNAPRWWHALFASRSLSKPLVGMALALLIATVSLTWLFFRTRRLEAELERLRGGQEAFPTEIRKLAEQLAQLQARNDQLTANLRDSEAQRARAEEVAAAALADSARRGSETVNNGGRAAGDAASARRRPQVIPLVLSMVSGRGTGAAEEPVKVLNLSPDAGRVRLYLNIETVEPADYEGFRVELKKRHDETLVQRVDVRPRASQKQLVVTFPASLLADEEYLVELNGLFNRGQSEPVGLYLFRVAPRK